MDGGTAVRKSPAMKRALFLPTARQTNWLLVIGLLSLGEALYLRYMALENNTVSLACQAGLRAWLGDTFRLTIVPFNHNVFARAAPAPPPLHLVRPSIRPGPLPPPPAPLRSGLRN